MTAATVAGSAEPISIVLPHVEKDGCKITSEIILNFDQLDQERFLEGLREINESIEEDDQDNQSKVSSNENETCIELTAEKDSDMSDDDDDDDDLNKIPVRKWW